MENDVSRRRPTGVNGTFSVDAGQDPDRSLVSQGEFQGLAEDGPHSVAEEKRNKLICSLAPRTY